VTRMAINWACTSSAMLRSQVWTRSDRNCEHAATTTLLQILATIAADQRSNPSHGNAKRNEQSDRIYDIKYGYIASGSEISTPKEVKLCTRASEVSVNCKELAILLTGENIHETSGWRSCQFSKVIVSSM
jgi:hypothetical protein